MSRLLPSFTIAAVALCSATAFAAPLAAPHNLPAASAYQAVDDKTMTVDVDEAIVRDRASTQGKILTRLPKGTAVAVKEMTATGWAHIEINGSQGYIDGTALK